MSTTGPGPTSDPRPLPRRAPPVLVLGVFALVVAGALVSSLVFFTAGLVLIPVLVAASLLYVFFSARRDRGPGGPPDATPP